MTYILFYLTLLDVINYNASDEFKSNEKDKKGKNMRLQDFLDKHEMTKKELCERADINTQTLFRLLQGKVCQLPTAAKIEMATFGKVTCLDLYKEFMQEEEKVTIRRKK